MKKLITVLAVFVAITSSALADEFTQDASRLPQVAQDYIKSNFPNLKITGIEIDKGFFFVKDYEAFLSDGTSIEFNPNGEWTSIKNKMAGVPVVLINKKIVTYVSLKYPAQKIISIEKEKYGFKIELSSDVEIKFSANGDFIALD